MTETVTTAYLAENNLLGNINKHSAVFCQNNLHSVLPTIQHIEKQAGRTPSNWMGGIMSPSCSLAVSYNLCNSTHYDVSDGSIGYSVWVELIPGEAKNWYFILPNILIEYMGKTYNGLAIALSHGTCIAWDGRVIRHGTSDTIVSNAQNGCFGWFWSADMRSAVANMTLPKNQI